MFYTRRANLNIYNMLKTGTTCFEDGANYLFKTENEKMLKK